IGIGNLQPDAVPLFEYIRNRQHLDLEFVNLAGLKWLRISVRIKRAQVRRAFHVLLAMRGLQPALGNRRERWLLVLFARGVVLRSLVRKLDDEMRVDRAR